jgi:hypothetical protein
MERVEITSKESLKQYLIQEKDPQIRLRLVGLNLMGGFEMSLEQAAEAVLIPIATISEWVLAWNRGGYRGIRQLPLSAMEPAEFDDHMPVCSYLRTK